MSDVTVATVSRALRAAGWRVRTSAPRAEETVRVYEMAPGRIKVKVDFKKTTVAVWYAERMAGDLREVGFSVEAEDGKTFFYVTGLKKEG